MTTNQQAGPSEVNPDEDRYRTIHSVLAEIMDQEHIPDVGVERIEVTCLASGDATYRWWLPRADEYEGGYLPPPE